VQAYVDEFEERYGLRESSEEVVKRLAQDYPPGCGNRRQTRVDPELKGPVTYPSNPSGCELAVLEENQMNQGNRTLLVVFAVLLVAILLGPVLMGGMMGPGFVGPGMMGWGYAAPGGVTSGGAWMWGLGMGLGGLAMLLFWAALIIGVVLLVRWATSHSAAGTAPTGADDPMTILRRRYASGEIDQATYQRMSAELAGAATAAARPVDPNGRTEVPR
jgi:putative membrane protein